VRVGSSPSVGEFRGLLVLIYLHFVLMAAVLMNAAMPIDEMDVDEEAMAVSHADL
jgi:hypothetical protein